MTKKHNVQLIDVTYGHAHPLASGSMFCGTKTQKEIEKFIRDLSAKKILPKDTCIYQIYAHFHNTEKIDAYLLHNISNMDTPCKEHDSSLEICIHKQEQKCSSKDCFYNIQNGKCVDPFVIDTIGKKFFANKYNDKQR